MSARFILEYAGAPMAFSSGGASVVPEHMATRFIAEAEAWQAAHSAGLVPMRCRVVDLHERNGQPKSQLS